MTNGFFHSLAVKLIAVFSSIVLLFGGTSFAHKTAPHPNKNLASAIAASDDAHRAVASTLAPPVQRTGTTSAQSDPTSPGVTEHVIVNQMTLPANQDEVNGKLAALKDDLLARIAQITTPVWTFSGPAESTPVSFQTFAVGQKIDNLSGVTISNATMRGVSGLTDADIPDTIIASNYLPLSGGALSGDLTVAGNFTVAGTQTLSGAITIPYLTATSTNASVFSGSVGVATSSVGTVGTSSTSVALTVGGNLYLGAKGDAAARSTVFFQGDNGTSHVGGLQFDPLNYGGTIVITPTNNAGQTLDSTIRFGGSGNFNSNVINLLASGTTTSSLGFKVGSNFAVQQSGDVSTAGGYSSTKAINYSGSASAFNNPFYWSGSATGTCSGTGTACALNRLFINSDSVVAANSGAIVAGLNISHNFGGGQGGFDGIHSIINMTAATLNTNNTGYYVADDSTAQATANDTGTGGSYSGHLYGIATNVRLTGTATYWDQLVGQENDVAAYAGSSVNDKIGLQIVQTSNDAVSADRSDIGLSLNNGSGATGWKIGIGFGAYSGYNPMNSAGTLIGTYAHGVAAPGSGAMGTVANGMDFSNYTFSNKFLNSTGFSVDGSGNTRTLSVLSSASSTIGDGSQAGGLTISGGATTTGFLSITGSTGTTSVASGEGFTIGSSQFVLQQGSGNVGIGIAAPNTALHVYRTSGNASAYIEAAANNTDGYIEARGHSGSTQVTTRLWASSGAIGNMGTISNHPVAFLTNGTERVRITTAGNLGIASTSPWRTLSVTGTVGFDGLTGSTGAGSLCLDANRQVVYNSGSDACLSSLRNTKHDIADLSFDAITMVKALDPVSFVYNTGDGRTRYGFIAEDAAAVDAHLATYDASGTISGIDDRAIISIIVRALKDLIAKLDDLAATVAGFATSFTTRHLTTHELCIDDTCVTKTQFEALLKMAGQHSESATAANQPNPQSDGSVSTSSATTDAPPTQIATTTQDSSSADSSSPVENSSSATSSPMVDTPADEQTASPTVEAP